MNFLSIFENIFRWLLWLILKLLFFLVDTMYDAIKSIAYFNILDNSTVWTYFSVFITAFLSLFIIIRLSKRFFKSIVDEEEAAHFKAENVIAKIAAIGFLIIVLPFLLKTFGDLLSRLVQSIESIFNVDSNSFSSIILQSAIGDIDINSIDSIDINEKHHGNYLFLPNMNVFLCLFIVSVFSGYLMLLIGIQLGGRMLSMVMKLIIAPYSLSSLVDERNDSFATWWKLFMADFLSTYVQMILLLVGTTLILGLNFNAGNSFTSGLAKDIALIGALFAVLNAPNGISQIIGSDIGVSSALQSMQTSMMAMNITSSAGRLIGGIASYAGAAATYGTGRALGGASMSQIAAGGTPGTKTITGSLTGGLGGFQSGQGGNISDVSLSMSETPGQAASFASNRSGMSGWSDILPSFRNGGVGDGLSSIKNSGAPNVVGAVSNFDKSNGSVRQMLNAGSFGGVALRAGTWGASKLYGASMNRLQRGFTGHHSPRNDFRKNMAMMNTTTQQSNNFNNIS